MSHLSLREYLKIRVITLKTYGDLCSNPQNEPLELERNPPLSWKQGCVISLNPKP